MLGRILFLLLLSSSLYAQPTENSFFQEAMHTIRKEYKGCSLPLLDSNGLCTEKDLWKNLPGRDTVFPLLQFVELLSDKEEKIVQFNHYLFVKRGPESFLQFTYHSKYYFKNCVLEKMEEYDEEGRLLLQFLFPEDGNKKTITSIIRR